MGFRSPITEPTRRPANRLGVNGSEEVKQHIWLRDIKWSLLQEQKIQSPLLVSVQKNNNRKYKLKITVLERRIVTLENYISELVVSLHCIFRVLNYLRR